MSGAKEVDARKGGGRQQETRWRVRVWEVVHVELLCDLIQQIVHELMSVLMLEQPCVRSSQKGTHSRLDILGRLHCSSSRPEYRRLLTVGELTNFEEKQT